MARYAVSLTRRYDGLFIATFPDLPGLVAYGRDDEEALEEAEHSLRAAWTRKAAAGEAMPLPAACGGLTVSLEPGERAALA